MKPRIVLKTLTLAALLAVPTAALAWGNTGHRLLGEAAALALPPEVPAFVRAPKAVVDLGEYSREADRLKGNSRSYDNDRSPAHFVDLGDDGKIFGGPSITALPPNREDYDAALRAVGQDSWKAGYLPYAILDSYHELVRDFAYWRVLSAAEADPRWKSHRAWFAADRKRRETQLLIHAGQLSHFVGDGSQPLHVTLHFNGWGDFPNPEGFSNARTLHAAFEGDLVNASISRAQVTASLAPLRDCSCAVEQRMADFLAETGRQVAPLYRLDKSGALVARNPAGVGFAVDRLAAGASELRDLVVAAWRASANQTVGWKPVAVGEMTSGKVDPYLALYSSTD